MRLRYAAKTDVGKRRARNEDHYALDAAVGLFVVADGMGGHAAGDVASRLASQTVVEAYRRMRTAAGRPSAPDPSPTHAENQLVAAIHLANRRILGDADRSARLRGMGTTLVAAAVVADHICIAHVGDSRAYRIRDGAITQLTRDHSLLEAFKEDHPGMSAKDEAAFPYRNVITRSLGLRDKVEVDVQSHAMRSGDRYAMCSDGLSGMVSDQEIVRIASKPLNLERIVTELVDAANRNGGDDNITVVLIESVAL